MKRLRYSESKLDRVVILFLFALVLLLSPLVKWWTGEDVPWYSPYLIWALIIFLTFRLERRSPHDEL